MISERLRDTPLFAGLDDAHLEQHGPYGLARHPIYGGGVIAIVGWALLNGGWLGLLAEAGVDGLGGRMSDGISEALLPC